MYGAESRRWRPGGGGQKGAEPAGFVVLLSRDPSELQQLSETAAVGRPGGAAAASANVCTTAETQTRSQEHVCTGNLQIKRHL